MQIREKGMRLVLIRTKYDSTVKRGVSKQIGSLSKFETVIPDDVRPNLEADEIEQLEQFLAESAAARSARNQASTVKTGQYSLGQLVSALGDPEAVKELDQARADAIWEQISALQKALKKAGFKRPRKTEDDVTM